MVRSPEERAGVADVDLSDRTVLVTGATDGIGRETALALGRLGAAVLVHGRDPGKGEAVVADLDRTAAADAAFVAADYTSLDAVRDLADEARAYGVDVLVNNAGAYFPDGALTDAGVERTFAVNHLAPFLLTNLLVPSMPADGRVVTVASAVHHRAELDLSAAGSVDDYDGLAAYRHSKLANVLFTRELARRIDQPANCLHPGFVPGSAIWRSASWRVALFVGLVDRLPRALAGRIAETVPGAATTSVYLAAAPAAGEVTGRYFVDCEPADPAPQARDDAAAGRLWAWSARVAAVEPVGDDP
ncbi:MAG: SDR family NAD(P)-dependent oxidoreductase [Haloarculaceae archaeon]